jgi:mRNA interferase HigB
MWIVTENRLKLFWTRHRTARAPLLAWLKEFEKARYEAPSQIKAAHRSADFVGDKVVFNIGGNKFRLVVRIRYARPSAVPPLNGIVYVRFIGTHKEYDAVDVAGL